MKNKIKSLLISVGVGTIVGASVHATIGGMGLAVSGTAVGITLGPMIVISTGISLTVYGAYKLGKGRIQGNKDE